MNRQQTIGQRLFVAFILGLILFNYPILGLFAPNRLIGGIPLAYIYIFVVWVGLILLTALITKQSQR